MRADARPEQCVLLEVIGCRATELQRNLFGDLLLKSHPRIPDKSSMDQLTRDQFTIVQMPGTRPITKHAMYHIEGDRRTQIVTKIWNVQTGRYKLLLADGREVAVTSSVRMRVASGWLREDPLNEQRRAADGDEAELLL